MEALEKAADEFAKLYDEARKKREAHQKGGPITGPRASKADVGTYRWMLAYLLGVEFEALKAYNTALDALRPAKWVKAVACGEIKPGKG